MIKFNKNNNMIIPFTIILSNRNHDLLGEIVNTSGVNFTGNFNSADELSFTVYKTLDGYDEPLWDEIYDLRLVYIQELDEYFEISVSVDDQAYLTKTITGTSLCEAELGQTILYGVEINTETDIERDDYKVAKFWTNVTDPESEEYKNTILYRVLEKVPAYSVDHVDPTLVDLQRVFSINNKSVYDWLVNDCATEFNCLVKFNSADRTISFYDLYTTCPVCHSRGMYNDKCTHIITQDDIDKYGSHGQMPNGAQLGGECGNTDLNYYGDDTTIFVSTENLTDEIKYETDVGSIKNSFRLVAGDDDMTAAVVNINPNGSQYIYNYSPESLRDMPAELVQAIKDYNALYDEYNYKNTYDIKLKSKWYDFTKYSIDNNNDIKKEIIHNVAVTYNTIVQKYAHAYEVAKEEKLIEIPTSINGYANLMEHIYQCFDFYSYLESSMMPRVEIGGVTVDTEAQKVRDHNGDGISIANYGGSTNVNTVNNAIINYLKIFVKTGYVKVEVEENSVSYPEPVEIGDHYFGSWSGNIIVTFYSLDDDDVNKRRTISCTFPIDDDYETFIQQKLMKKLAKDVDEDDQTYNLLDPGNNMSLSTFETNLKAYSLHRLQAFRDSIDALLGIMQEAKIPNKETQQRDPVYKSVYDDFYIPMYARFLACEEEYNLRANELSLIAEYTNGVMSGGLLNTLLTLKEDINDKLDFKKFLDARSTQDLHLYELLTTYTRQDEYNNSNYISAGLANDELFMLAQMFYEAAEEELLKSSTYQHSITANMHNLLAMDEFAPIVDYFELGNWIRVKIDETVYRLRLISYSVNFDDPTTLDTQFSDVTATGVGYNDLQSVMKQATSMSTSYSGVTKQAELGKLADTKLNQWVLDGLNSAKTRIMNNDTEEIEITNAGITAKTFNDLTETYDDEQLRITHNVLAFTNDNWKTINTALGKADFTYHIPHETDPTIPGVITPKKDTYYGLLAEFVMSGHIVGSEIEGSSIIGGHIQGVGNTSYVDLDPLDIEYDSDGVSYPDFLHLEGAGKRFIVDKDGNLTTTGGHFSNGKEGAAESYLDLNESTSPYPDFLHLASDNSKNLFAITKDTGTVISRGGHFQNYDNSVFMDLNAAGEPSFFYIEEVPQETAIITYFLMCDPEGVGATHAPFSVTKEGLLTTNLGKIGHFYITDTYFSSTQHLDRSSYHDISMSMANFSRSLNVRNSGSTNISNLRFAIGNYFGVGTDGKVYAKNLITENIDCDNRVTCDDLRTTTANINAATLDNVYAAVRTDIISTNVGVKIEGVQILNGEIFCYPSIHSTDIKYTVPFMRYGTTELPEGSILPSGTIYLQYE